MKKLLTLAILILTGSMFIYSQVPQAMTYKAIAKDDWGIALPNKAITLRFTIIQDSEYGTEIFRETHNTITSKFGLMDVKIGTGSPDFGSFTDIDWSAGVYYIKIEMDPKGGSDFRLEDPPHQLLSVPYALYAGAAGNTNFSETDPVFTSHPASVIKDDDIINWNTAFNWGNHALQGYLTTENDPVVEQNFDFNGAVEGDLLQYNGTKWVKLTPGYIISESDPLFAEWNKSTGISITESQITDLKHFTNADETDPIYTATFGITNPQNGDLLRFNSATGKWEVFTPQFAANDHIHDEATTEVAGFMGPDDKTKLDGLNNADGSETKIYEGANITITGDGTEATPYVISSAGSSGALTLSQVLGYGNDAGNKRITNLVDPIDAQDAATRAYVDALKTLLFLTTDPGMLLENGVGVADLVNTGVSITDLIAAGASVADFHDAGYGVIDLFNAGVGVGTLEQKGADPQELANAGLIGTLADVDGNTYKWVKIGTQIWMAENLAYLPSVSPSPEASFLDPYYYVYDYEGSNVSEAKATDNYATYGVLYNWPAAMAGSASSANKPSGVQGVCPAGWHLPSDLEWKQLNAYLGGIYLAGGKLKETGTTHWKSPNTGATNESGFTALPGGGRIYGKKGDWWIYSFFYINESGRWWSATEHFAYSAFCQAMTFDSSTGGPNSVDKDHGFSVRCVKDYTPLLPPEADFTASATTISTFESIQFTDQSTNNPTGWSWDFGDGGTSEEQNPSHAYSTEGTYTISLTVFNNDASDTKTKSDYITVTWATSNETGTLTDTRDDQVYQTVKIGDQWWMAENLAYLPSVSPPSAGNSADPYYYVYDYLGTSVSDAKTTSNYQTYGVLYNWPAAMAGAASSAANPSGVQGVCPAGWHLPSDLEWTQLTDYLGGEYVAGDKLKEYGTTHWESPNTGATNESGFTALPGGLRGYNGNFFSIGDAGLWWSATEYNSSYAWLRYLEFGHGEFSGYSYYKDFGYSVRCVKDD